MEHKTTAERDAAFAEAWKAGATPAELREQFGVARSTVFALQKRLGLPSRRPERDDEAFTAAWNSGTSIRALAARFHVGAQSVRPWAERLGLEPRARREKAEPLSPRKQARLLAALRQGWPVYEIARMFNIADATVSRYGARAGLPSRVEIRRQVVARMVGEGATVAQIAEALHCTRAHARRLYKGALS